jgi:hypothetical protein
MQHADTPHPLDLLRALRAVMSPCRQSDYSITFVA